MPDDKDDLIRDRAYEIWLREGCPDGAQVRHWSQARAEIEAEREIGATESLADTELTLNFAAQDDPVEDETLGSGEMLSDAEPEAPLADDPDLRGRVKKPRAR